MKSLLAVSLVALAAHAARAQEFSSPASAAFAPTSSASIAGEQPAPPLLFTSPVPTESRLSLAALSFSNASATLAPATASRLESAASAAPHAATPTANPNPEPASPPRYNYSERDYRLEIAIGVSLVRFRSDVYYATGVGSNTAVAYYLNNWLAVEGAISSAFAPSIFQGENIKYLGYGGGPKISLGRSRLEPWLHVLAGGVHLIPQTGLSSKNGFEITGGLGVDYALGPRFAIRLEGDYLRTHIFAAWQNSAQVVAALVIHF
jgi:Outer membrane protein beta-barrel domain